MVSDGKFLASLKAFDKDNIPPHIVAQLPKFTVQEDFQVERLEKVSKAATGLCMWVRAMEVYDRVAKQVAPKKEKLAEAEAEYKEVMAKLEIKQAELKKIMDKLQALNDKL